MKISWGIINFFSLKLEVIEQSFIICPFNPSADQMMVLISRTKKRRDTPNCQTSCL